MTLLTPGFLPTKTVPFGPDATRLNMRYMLQNQGLQEGVMGANDMKVVQNGGGAQSANVGAGFAWVQGDGTAKQGLYPVYNDATVTVAATAANGSNPRIDCLVVHVYDSSISGASDVPLFEIVAGTATSGATLDNRTGAPAIPTTALLLADMLRPTATNNITTANIRDRRPWARGAYTQITRSAGNYTTTSTSFVEVDATNLKPRIECLGSPIKVRVNGGYASHNIAGETVTLAIGVDGSAQADYRENAPYIGSGRIPNDYEWTITPTAGSHQISLMWKVSSGTGALQAGTNAGYVLNFQVEEIVRQNANNS